MSLGLLWTKMFVLREATERAMKQQLMHTPAGGILENLASMLKYQSFQAYSIPIY